MTIVIPQPLTDELVASYVGRIRRVNDRSALRGLPKATHGHGKKQRELFSVDALAQLAGMPLDAFALKHSLLPVLRAVAKIELGAMDAIVRRYAFTVPGDEARACSRCIEDDATNCPIDYWHREHHLPGIDWCPTHHAPLDAATDAGFLSPPSGSGLRPVNPDPSACDDEMCNPALARLQAILMRWLHAERPVHPLAACEALKERCAALGLRSSQSGRRPVISDVVRSAIPRSWLRRHYPDLLEKSDGVFLQRLDGTGCDRHVAYPSIAYAVALAATFDSADAALAAIDKRNTERTAVAQAHSRASRPEGQLSSLTGQPHLLPRGSDIGNERPAIRGALLSFLEGTPLATACRLHDIRHRELEAAVRDLLTARACAPELV